MPGYNVRSTEINAVFGRSQLKRLDEGNRRRSENLALFLENLNPEWYQTDFATEGSSNYAFTLILRHADEELMRAVMAALRAAASSFVAARRAAAIRSPALPQARCRLRRLERVSPAPITSISTAPISATIRLSKRAKSFACARCSTLLAAEMKGGD